MLAFTYLVYPPSDLSSSHRFKGPGTILRKMFTIPKPKHSNQSYNFVLTPRLAALCRGK